MALLTVHVPYLSLRLSLPIIAQLKNSGSHGLYPESNDNEDIYIFLFYFDRLDLPVNGMTITIIKSAVSAVGEEKEDLLLLPPIPTKPIVTD